MYTSSRKKDNVPLLAVAPPPGRSQAGQPMPSSAAVGPSAALQQLGRRISPAPERGRFPPGTRPRAQPGVINIGQPTGLPTGRQRDKFVPLPEEDDEEGYEGLLPPQLTSDGHDLVAGSATSADGMQHEDGMGQLMHTPAIFEDLPRRMPTRADDSRRGRITFYCVAESFDRKKLDELLKLTYTTPGTIKSYPDVFYIEVKAGACAGR